MPRPGPSYQGKSNHFNLHLGNGGEVGDALLESAETGFSLVPTILSQGQHSLWAQSLSAGCGDNPCHEGYI